MKDRFKINEKSLNQFQNGLRVIGRLWIKQGRKTNLFKTKKIQEALRDMFNTKIKTFKKKKQDDSLKIEIFWKRIKKNSKNAKSFTKWI